MGAGVTTDGDGKKVFVSGGAVGDVCDVRITAHHKSYSLGEIASLITPSPDRVTPDCPAYAEGCGGCSFRHVSYECELRAKRDHIVSLLSRAGADAAGLEIKSAGEREPRTKVTLPIGSDGRIGYYKKGTHIPVPCGDCRLHSSLTNAMLKEAEALIKNEKNAHFHHICLRHATYGTMLILFSEDVSDEAAAERIFGTMETAFPDLRSGYFCHKREDETRGVYTYIGGEEKIRDRLLGCEFLISPDAFYQVNHGSAEILYSLAAEYANVKDGESVADLYCGTGTIGISVLQRSGADAALYGIEIVESAVRDARENADINGVKATFLSSDAAKFDRHADVVIVDPPRAGCDSRLISHLITALPSRIVYVSCDPATLVRDVKILGEHYRVAKATAVDMFPRTGHCECICLLERE